MGSCVSVYRNSAAAIPPSPIKEKGISVDPTPNVVDDALKWSPPRSSGIFPHHHQGSKEESFFDSKPWLDSDAEDDFFSVNGDFTPSRGSTPVHHSFSRFGGVPVVNASLERGKTDASTNESSPSSQKKKLGQLFTDSTTSEEDAFGNAASAEKLVAIPEPTILDVLSSSKQGTPDNPGSKSTCSTEKTPPDGDLRPVKEKSARSLQRCLPRLTYCSNFGERNRKMNSGNQSIAVHE